MKPRRYWPLVLLFAVSALAGPALATPELGEQTGRECSYCHQTPGGPLTAQGEAFDEGRQPETLLSLPSWSRGLLLWAHLVGMTAWLGAIIFVHIVQTPRVAGRGIPRAYFILAWPSILALGVSGALLTLGDINGLDDLTSTRWGILLLAKIGIYLILVAVAALVTFVLSPRLRELAERREAHPLAEHVQHAQAGRISVGYGGQVYDVTASKMWKEGVHAGRHQAWQDLTGQMVLAPHGVDLLARFPVLGAGAGRTPPALGLFLILAYGNLGLVLVALLIVAYWIVG